MASVIKFFINRSKYTIVWLLLCAMVGVVSVGVITIYGSQGYRYFGTLCALLLTATIYIAILKNWRRGIYGLVIYLPFAGLPTILLYPAPRITLLIKDLLFVIPAYLGFILWWHNKNRHHTPVLFPTGLLGPLAMLASLLFIQFFNPRLANPLVGLIGLKVWLVYVPLFFLGYHFVDSRERLFQLAKLILFVALVPVLVGIAQAALVYSGHSELAYSFYGPAAAAVTQNFAYLGVDCVMGRDCRAALARVPSIFTFVTQYWLFLFAMYPLGYAMWVRANLSKNGSSQRYLVLLGLIVVAAVSSGSRAALAMTPFYFLLVIIMTGKWRQIWKLMVPIAGSFAVMAALLGVGTNTLINYTTEVVAHYLGRAGVMSEHIRALNTTWLGFGVGMSTGPARYAFTAGTAASKLVGLESFYAKTIVELGVPGLIIVLVLFAWLLLSGYRHFVRLKDPILRAFAAALLALLLVTVIYLTKGTVVDYDPLNVYFWLFAGILMKLPRLETRPMAEAKGKDQ